MPDLADIQVPDATLVDGKLTVKKTTAAALRVEVPGSSLTKVGQQILIYAKNQDHDDLQLTLKQEHLLKPWKFELPAKYLGGVDSVVLNYAVTETGVAVKRSKPVEVILEYI